MTNNLPEVSTKVSEPPSAASWPLCSSLAVGILGHCYRQTVHIFHASGEESWWEGTEPERCPKVAWQGSPKPVLHWNPQQSMGITLFGDSFYLCALDRGQFGNARVESVHYPEEKAARVTWIYACSSDNSDFLNSPLIAVCLTDDLQHLIYWSYFTLPAISLLWSDLASRFSLPNRWVF